MTNDDRPAASGGGSRTAPDTDVLAELPDKLRVHALARLLGLSSKDVLAALAEVGSPVKGAQSSIDRATALRVADVLLPDPADPGGESAEEIEDGGLVAPLVPVFAPPQPLFIAPGSTRELQLAAGEVDEVDDVDDVDDVDELAEADDGAARRRRRRGRRGRGRGKA